MSKKQRSGGIGFHSQIKKAALTYNEVERLLKYATSPVTILDAKRDTKVQQVMTNDAQVADVFKSLHRRGVIKKLDYHGPQRTTVAYEWIPEKERQLTVSAETLPPRLRGGGGPLSNSFLKVTKEAKSEVNKPTVRITKNAIHIESNSIKVTIEY